MEEQAVCVNENVYLIKWIASVLWIVSENSSLKKSSHMQF